MVAQVLVLNGPPGVGKTTIGAKLTARCPGSLHVRGDDLRAFAPKNVARHLGHGSTHRAAGALAAAYLDMGAGLVVLDYCFLQANHVERVGELVPASAQLTLVTLWAPLDVVEARERARADEVGNPRSPLSHRVAECWHLMWENREKLGHFVNTHRLAPDQVADDVLSLLEASA